MKLYKRISVLLTMGIMGIGLTTFRFSPAEANMANERKNSEITAEVTVTPTAIPTTAPTPTPEPNNLTRLSEEDPLYQLVQSFLAAKLTCSREAFEGIVSDLSFIDENELQQRYATINEFKDITCYSKKGKGDIKYVIYYTYYLDITTIEADAISIDRVCIDTDDNGNYRIYIGDVADDVQAYIDELNSDEDVQTLINETYQKLQEEISNDEDLLAYLIRLYNNLDESDENPDFIEDTSDSDSSDDGSGALG